eukprot:7039367-Prymnesium_polylepis.1
MRPSPADVLRRTRMACGPLGCPSLQCAATPSVLACCARAWPQVTTFDIDVAKDEKIVMGSDGVWEFIESDQAVKITDDV